jgi:hypothetical protein
MSIVFYDIFAKTRFDGNIYIVGKGDSILKNAGKQVPNGRLTGQCFIMERNVLKSRLNCSNFPKYIFK